jgi:hypothetical protein
MRMKVVGILFALIFGQACSPSASVTGDGGAEAGSGADATLDTAHDTSGPDRNAVDVADVVLPGEAGGVPSFPLKISSNGRYLVDQKGTPFRIHGYALWSLISAIATTSDLDQLLTALRAIGVNTVYVMMSDHDSDVALGRGAGDGPRSAAGAFPFLKDTTGATYAGTGYTGPNEYGYSAGTSTGTEFADMSTPNPTYFGWADTVLDACLSAGIVVMLFPAYLGYGGGDQGWAADLTASGATKVEAYGQFIGNRYKDQSNIIWMAYGDTDPGNISGMDTLLVDLITSIQGAGATQLWAGHLPKDEGSPYDDATVAPYMNLNSVYVWTLTSTDDSPEYTLTLNASQRTPASPAFFFDDAAYEYDPYNTTDDTNDVRKRKWWGLLSGTAGVTFGNEYMSSGGSTGNASTTGTYTAMTTPGALYNNSTGLPTDGHKQFGVMAEIMNALPWWLLLPANVGSVGMLVTSGGGTSGGQDYVAAAADPAGSLLVAYVPPAHSGSLTISASAVSGEYTATWIDPTSGSKTSIGAHLSGSQVFNPPAANAYGSTDWVLLLQSM